MTKSQALKAIKAVGGIVSDYNLQAFMGSKSKDLVTSLRSPYNLLKSLEKLGEITVLPTYPVQKEILRYQKFYVPYNSKRKQIANRRIDHESMLTDVLLAFHFLYSDCLVEITRNPTFNAGGHVFNPDAHVRIIHPYVITFDFIIEVERSRQPKAIYYEKFLKDDKLEKLEDMGLSSKTKILYVVADQEFPIYKRPSEYRDYVEKGHQINFLMKAIIDRQENTVDTLCGYLSKIKRNRHLVLPYHDFYRLDEALWKGRDGQKTKLINV